MDSIHAVIHARERVDSREFVCVRRVRAIRSFQRKAEGLALRIEIGTRCLCPLSLSDSPFLLLCCWTRAHPLKVSSKYLEYYAGTRSSSEWIFLSSPRLSLSLSSGILISLDEGWTSDEGLWLGVYIALYERGDQFRWNIFPNRNSLDMKMMYR